MDYEHTLVFGNMRSAIFYRTPQWKRARYLALTTHGNRCQLCGSGPALGPLHVDHILPRSLFPDRCLDPSNLQVLCEPCHTAKGLTYFDDCRAKTTKNVRLLQDLIRVERQHLLLEQRPPTQNEVRWLGEGVRAPNKNHRARWRALVRFCMFSRKTYTDAVRITVGEFLETPWAARREYVRFLHAGGNGPKAANDQLFDIDGCTFPNSLSALLADDQRRAIA